MSTKEQSSREGGRPKDDRKPEFKFTVDKEHFESTEQRLTGAQIKAIAHVDPSVELFLEESGPGSDRQINDDSIVELKEHGQTRFYTMPRANMGAR